MMNASKPGFCMTIAPASSRETVLDRRVLSIGLSSGSVCGLSVSFEERDHEALVRLHESAQPVTVKARSTLGFCASAFDCASLILVHLLGTAALLADHDAEQ